MNLKKTLITLSLLALLSTATACGSQNEPDVTLTNQPSTSPSASTAPMTDPLSTLLPGMNDGMNDGMDSTDGELVFPTADPESAGVTSMDKAQKAIEQLEEELERLSEVDEAQVVIAGNKAAVALEFDDQYKAGIDDRLRQIVRERVDSVIRGIDTLAITDQEGIMDTLEALGDRFDGAADMASLQKELDAVLEKIGDPKMTKA